ncbi:MAG: YfhO family protein, partial [Candidatus Uhrbacteria bacterium]|nr:YfhO family protein [Candidatus Uhrbacteria bacterium]
LMSFRSPLYLLLHPLPVLSWFRWHFKWSFLTVFAAAVLAGYAFDAIRTFVEHRRAKAFLVAGWSALGVAVTGLAAMTVAGGRVRTFMINMALARYEQSSAAIGRELPRSAEYYRWLIEQMADSFVKGFSFFDPWTAFSVYMWLAVLAVVTLAATGRLSHKRLRDGLLLTTVAGSFVWTGFLVGEPLSYLTETPATARFLHEQNAYRTVPVTEEQAETHVPYRIFTFFPDQTIADLQDRFRIELVSHQNRAWLSRELLDDNINTWFRIDGMFNHEPLTESRITLLFTRATHGDATRTDATLPENIARFSSTGTARELGMQNVKYVTTNHELSAPWKRVFESRAVEGMVPVFVYENPFFLPRWYLADSIEWIQGASTEGLTAALDRVRETERTTLLESRSPSDAALQTRADPDDTLSLIRYTAGALTLATNTAYPRWVVFSETGVSYWRAFVDGRAVPIYRANAAYQAVLVPAGTHEISFEYPGFWE